MPVSCFSLDTVVCCSPQITIPVVMETQVHIVVAGLVQGVGYRWFVAHHARRLGLTGFVRNLPDGSVEVGARGERPVIEELITELRIGPRSAQVKELRIEWQPAASAGTISSEQFDIR
jgi:acylphosphatase